jgi:hypothetical protein
MFDWSTLLVPIAVLAVLMLFRFVGCGFTGQAGVDIDTDDPYENAVEKDGPFVFYRLQEIGTPGTVVDRMQHKDGVYSVATSALSEPAYLSATIAVPSIQLGAASIMLKEPSATSVRFNGSVAAAFGQITDLPRFTLEVIVSPEWDVANQLGLFYCVIENSMRTVQSAPQKNAGFAIFAGPDNIVNPTVSPYCWQLWIGTGNAFERANPIAGGPGPLVKAEPTYLAVTFDEAHAFLYAYNANANIDLVKNELIRRPYIQATETLRIGIAGTSAALIPPFPGPAGFLYPFVGRMAEVAIYPYVLDEQRIISHIMSAFNL